MIKTQIKNTVIMVVVSVALIFGVGAVTKKKPVSYTPGNYYGTAAGNAEGIWVEVEVSNDTILSVKVIEHKETAGICEPAVEQIPGKIVDANSPMVAAVSGATKTSEGIKAAVTSCLNQASGKEAIVSYVPEVKEDPVPLDYSYNAGVYTASADGFEETINVEVEFSETEIVRVTVLNKEDGEERVKAVNASVPGDIVKWQTNLVDAASGATFTSKGVMDAVGKCIDQAKK